MIPREISGNAGAEPRRQFRFLFAFWDSGPGARHLSSGDWKKLEPQRSQRKSRGERKETMEPGGAAALMVLTLMAVARLSHASQQKTHVLNPSFSNPVVTESAADPSLFCCPVFC
jgi:hypothetical protein